MDIIFCNSMVFILRGSIWSSRAFSNYNFYFEWCGLGPIGGVILVLSCFHACGVDAWALVREHNSWYILMAFSVFGCRSEHPMCSRDLIHVPNGVVR